MHLYSPETTLPFSSNRFPQSLLWTASTDTALLLMIVQYFQR